MSKQKQDKQGGGWQFPRPLEIIKCKEGNKEYMKERPARKPYGRIVKVCEFSLEAVAEFGDDDARAVMGTECTAAERLEIEANYAFFRAAMEEELEIFYSAFACKNNLFPSEDKAKPRDIEELSPEEKARYMKVGLMAEGMERHTLRKAIAAGETE